MPEAPPGCATSRPGRGDAFERAVAQGAVILETDVHVSRDGALVLFRDDGLERTTELIDESGLNR